ncbi:SEC-C domain-containing protein [Bacillus cereus]|nr:SEC-C domain-containing protein [Bacillus cereus]MCU4729679.1 SEC-C metal-binding domain-containing protein [Bacillus cereus]MDA2607848.1 SEC-C metal-binding domain-containing protein [Bacillus cereus]
MLSVLKRELNEFPQHRLLKKYVHDIHKELEQAHYNKVIEISFSSIEICRQIKEQAVRLKNEEVANSMFVVAEYCKMFKCYSNYWIALMEERFQDSWVLLQDTIDKIINVNKFTENHSAYKIDKFNELFYTLEKLYPYKLFASIEAVIKTKICSICGKNAIGLDCLHITGSLYWGEMANVLCKDIALKAVAIVTHPLDKRCVMELSDDNRTEAEKFQLLNYFITHNKHPLKIFSVNESEKYFYNDKYENIKRNDICPCGSNKKFKVCCGTSKYNKGSHYNLNFKEDIELKRVLS